MIITDMKKNLNFVLYFHQAFTFFHFWKFSIADFWCIFPENQAKKTGKMVGSVWKSLKIGLEVVLNLEIFIFHASPFR